MRPLQCKKENMDLLCRYGSYQENSISTTSLPCFFFARATAAVITVITVLKNVQKEHKLLWDCLLNILTDSPNIIKAIWSY